MTPKRAASTQQPSRPPNLTVSRLSAAKQISSQVEKGEGLLKISVSSDEEFDSLKHQLYSWDEYNTELLVRIFDNDQIYQTYRSYGFGISDGPLYQKIKELNNDISGSIRRLESIRDRLPLIPEPKNLTDKNNIVTTKQQEISRDVFVVHGTDQGTKETVARFLSRLDLVPLILHEKPNLGDTIIEKLERNSSVAYSIVLLTGDDEAYPISDSSLVKPRARQNVIFELGYFIAKLGRNKVCALFSEGVEIPSDFQGVVYIPFDSDGAWQLKLAKELKASGLYIDMNKAL